MSSNFTVDSMLRAEILSKAIVGQPPYKAVVTLSLSKLSSFSLAFLFFLLFSYNFGQCVGNSDV